MQFRNSDSRFGVVAQLFHWVIVALIITQHVLAQIFEDMKLGKAKIDLIVRHKEIGMLILILAVFRLTWRFFDPVPPLPANLKAYERTLAKTTHFLLYFFIFAIPISGWVMSSVANIPVSFFGLFEFPALMAANKPWVDPVKEVHEVLNGVLLAVVALHIAAALKHHFVLKDDVLRRMLPQIKRG